MENDLLGNIVNNIVMEKVVRDKMLNLDKSMHKIRFWGTIRPQKARAKQVTAAQLSLQTF